MSDFNVNKEYCGHCGKEIVLPVYDWEDNDKLTNAEIWEKIKAWAEPIRSVHVSINFHTPQPHHDMNWNLCMPCFLELERFLCVGLWQKRLGVPLFGQKETP